MELYLYVLFCIMFFACAVMDYRSKKVPDIIVSLMWLFMAYTGELLTYFTVLFFFGVAYFSNSAAALFKKPFAGWGDILTFPIFVGCINSLWLATGDIGYLGLIPVALVLAAMEGYITKTEKVALTPYFFIALICGVVYYASQFIPPAG